MSFGGPSSQSRVSISPPERGSFPLDHEGECKTFMTDYLLCIKHKKGKHKDCRDLARSYLECRMERGLMSKEDLQTLGFKNTSPSLKEKKTVGKGQPN
ncbi:Cytochrome c oxidase assembly protein cox19 [Coelomomyces lativittatus]|nr:Cytochrome c oxidase assembly protein cox19 [Coelomomyces lativittatus]